MDRQAGSRPGIPSELTHFPWPIRDASADRIYLSHFLEHQPDILRAMAEVHRIAKPGAEVIVVTPHYSSPDSYSDPTHVHHLGMHSFDYFVADGFENFTYGSGGYKLLERRLTFGSNFLLDNLRPLFSALSPGFYEKHLAWVFPARNIVCRLQVLKELNH